MTKFERGSHIFKTCLEKIFRSLKLNESVQVASKGAITRRQDYAWSMSACCIEVRFKAWQHVEHGPRQHVASKTISIQSKTFVCIFEVWSMLYCMLTVAPIDMFLKHASVQHANILLQCNYGPRRFLWCASFRIGILRWKIISRDIFEKDHQSFWVFPGTYGICGGETQLASSN